jgi:hypothetical protein
LSITLSINSRGRGNRPRRRSMTSRPVAVMA